ncbi:MAG: glycosyltransferase [bacterium]|nr:glycosyltransferase [bacterium]
MKVVHVYKDYFPPIRGGIENHINLLCQQQKQYFQVEVLVANRKSRTELETIDGITVYKIAQLGRILSAPITPSFHRWFNRLAADIYHFHHPNPTAELAYLSAKPKGKLVLTWHSDIVRQAVFMPVYRPFLYRFLNKVDRILVTSQNYLDSSPILQNYKTKCSIVPLGIDLTQFKLTPRIERNIAEIKRQYPNPIILFVGKLRYYKGVHILIHAMQQVHHAQLLIIGSGPKQLEWQELTAQLGLQGKVTFLGEVDDSELVAYLYACEIFCLPSHLRSEAFGAVQLEAFACGKPVVSTNLATGVPFVNLHEKTGLVVEPNSPDALADAINRLLTNPDWAKQLGEAGRRRVEQEFTIEKIAAQINAIYQQIMLK